MDPRYWLGCGRGIAGRSAPFLWSLKKRVSENILFCVGWGFVSCCQVGIIKLFTYI